jgi:hypothetical protein
MRSCSARPSECSLIGPVLPGRYTLTDRLESGATAMSTAVAHDQRAARDDRRGLATERQWRLLPATIEAPVLCRAICAAPMVSRLHDVGVGQRQPAPVAAEAGVHDQAQRPGR